MIQQLISDFITSYDSVRGNSRIPAVFLTALLFMFLYRKKLKFNPFAMVIAPLALIAGAIGSVLKEALKKSRWTAVYTAFLTVFVIMLTGTLVYSGDHAKQAENAMHIPQDYVEAMDYVLSLEDNPKVLAMPDYSVYNRMYSSRFDMLYELRSGDDVRYLSEEARTAFTELCEMRPDMYQVSDAAKRSGCDYIMLMEGHYWPEIPLDQFDYELSATVSGWEIYKRKETGND